MLLQKDLLFYIFTKYFIIQFSSVAQSCSNLCDPMNCSIPGLPVHHHLPEFTQTHVHQGGDAIQPSHHLSPLFPLPPIPPSIRDFSNEESKQLNFVQFAKNVYAFVSILLGSLLWPWKKLQVRGLLKPSIMAFLVSPLLPRLSLYTYSSCYTKVL